MLSLRIGKWLLKMVSEPEWRSPSRNAPVLALDS